MDRGRIFFTFTWVLSFGLFLSSQHLARGKELRREVVCSNNVLQIDCGGSSFIAIHEAYFTTVAHENLTCLPPTPENEYIEDESIEDESGNASLCYEDIRISVNKNCSGSRTCSYSYNEPERKCRNYGGQFVVRYDCVKDSNVDKYCNGKVQSHEGYIASPGFPRYYPELSDCSWTLRGSPGQSILVKILHLHTRSATQVYPTVPDPDAFYAPGVLGLLQSGAEEASARCDEDALTVLEGTMRRAVLCGEDIQGLRSVEGEADGGMTIRFKTAGFTPASGFLAYFKVRGCPTARAPEGGHLVARNGSAALYACDPPRLFNDTLEGKRFLSCVRDHHWNDTLPPCTVLEEITTTVTPDKSMEMAGVYNITANETAWTTMASIGYLGPALLEDILIPCILIGVLILGNSVILAIICVIRRKQKRKSDAFDIEENEEPKSQPLVPEVKDV